MVSATSSIAVVFNSAIGLLQVSEKILLLDAEAKELRLAAAAADDRAEVLAREKVQVMGLAEELRADVAAKMALLDEFEARFARQYRWASSCHAAICPPPGQQIVQIAAPSGRVG
jgi:hypothetical protein